MSLRGAEHSEATKQSANFNALQLHFAKPLTDCFVGTSSLLAMTLLDFFFLPAHAAPSTDSLVGYWKFDETSGTSAADASGDGNTGTHTNGPTISTDVPSMISFTNARSLSFDGVDDYVDVGNGSALSFGNGDFTVAAWIKTNTTSRATVASKFQDIGSCVAFDGWLLDILATGEARVSLEENGTTDFIYRTSTATVNNNQWHHIVGQRSGQTWNIYVDGSLNQDTLNQSGTSIESSNSSVNLTIGYPSYCGSTYFPGSIDDVRIYNRALSATEIADLAAGSHTSATWDGSSSTNYETAANWDTNAIPDPYTKVTIANSGAAPVCTANIQTAGLTINSGASLNLDSYNLTLNDSGTFSNNGTLVLRNTETLTGFTNDTDSGGVLINGTSNVTGLKTGNTYNNLTLNDGPVAHWKLDETSGTSASDASGYGNTGTHTNGPTISTDVPSTISFPNARSLSFDGVDDYVDVGADSSLDFGTGDRTIALWIRKDAAGTRKFLYNQRDDSSNYIELDWLDTDVVQLDASTGGVERLNVQSSTVLDGNTWYHVVFSVDRDSAVNTKVYINGSDDTSGTPTVSTTDLSLTASVHFGRWSGGSGFYWDGLIDDVRIYNRALSSTEVANLAAGGHAGTSGIQTFDNNITVNGTLSLEGGNINSSSYTNTVTSLASIYGGTYTAGTASQTFNGGLTVAGGTYTGGTGTTDVNGVLTISAGTLTSPGSTSSLNVSGNFAHSGGTFTHNSGTVILDGNDQTISGATTFNNLQKTTSNTTLTFPASTTQTIAGALILQGASGLPISLRSSTDGTQWSIDPQGSRTVEYLDVKDSNNVNATGITTTDLNITDSGNNINWTFNQNPAAPTISSSTIAGASAGTGGTYSVNYGEALVINFTSTDADNSDTVTLSTPTSPTVGTFTQAMAANPGTAQFTFTPGVANAGMSYNFTVRATDNNSATSASDLTVTINVGSNIPPDTPSISSATINGVSTNSYVIYNGETLVINFTASDSNSSDTVILSTPSSPSVGTFTADDAANSGTASYTFTPTVDHVNRTHTFTVRATDNNLVTSDSDLSVSVKVNPTQEAIDAINVGIFETGQSLMGGNSGESSTTGPTIIVTVPTPPIDNRPETKPPKPPTKPLEPSKPPELPKPSEPSKPPAVEDIPEIEVKFPEIPDILKNPISENDEETFGGIGTIGQDPREPKKEPKKPKEDKPQDEPQDKGQEQQTNVVIAGSPTSFVLPPDAQVVSELKSVPLSDVDVKVVITDSKGVEHTVQASVLVGAGKDDNSPLVINTDTLPEDLATGKASISLLINGEAKAKINIVISESQFKVGAENENFTDENKPEIISVNAKRKKDILIVRIQGNNFYNKKLALDENKLKSETRLTKITMIPNTEVKRIKWILKKNGTIILAKYKILEKDLSGKMTISVTNPFGQAISTFEMP